MRRLALTAFGALGIGTLLMLAGCAANLDNPQRFEPTTTPSAGAGAGGAVAVAAAPDCVTAAFTKTCGTTACHQGTAASDLDLITAGVASRLVDVTAGHMGVANPSACPPAKFIDTSNPAASWLLIKLMGTNIPTACGSPMPLIGMLSSADQTCITTWVNSLGPSGSTGGAGGTGGATGGGAATAGSGGAAAGGGASGAAPAGGSGGASGGASSSAGTGGA